MKLEDKKRFEELREKMNSGANITTEEKKELDELTEEYNRTGGNPAAEPSK